MIGKLIPAGTGMERYKSLKIHVEGQEDSEEEVAE